MGDLWINRAPTAKPIEPITKATVIIQNGTLL
jgi:hypothetical protein